MSEVTETGRAGAAADGSFLTAPRGGPENLFDVGPLEAEPGQARASMATGPWLRGHGDRLSPAGLGVLLDDVLGQAMLNARPAGHWMVTTELNVDVVAPLPADGQVVNASACPVLLDGAGGLARAQVQSAAGRCLAMGSAWGRFITGVPDAVRNPPELEDVAARGRCLADLLQIGIGDTGDLGLPPRTDLGNPGGVVHGGVLFCLAVMSAERAMHGCGLDTASIRVVYLRPAAGELSFEPAVIHRGRSLGAVRVDVRNAAGALCTTATVTSRSAIGPGRPSEETEARKIAD